ncbi:MAG: M28 family peptidase [Candidatus Latescibacterota bacterium]|nr:MAG: M28 family peptidase [Candidatus Latescibacterota bacterium]
MPRFLILVATLVMSCATPASATDADPLVAAILGETPLIDDLRTLTDEIGGRPDGSDANAAAVEWALERFREAGVTARKEAFRMPMRWLERSASAQVRGDVHFSARVAAMPYSTPTATGGLTVALVDAGKGTPAEIEGLGARAKGAFLLVETPMLEDIPGLFREYMDAAATEARAIEVGVAGVVYVGSRPRNVLYRQIAALGTDNTRPMLVMERSNGMRALRLLRQGKKLELHVEVDLDTGPAYESHNVVAEIPGRELPNEFVVIGAHLDSWGLGTGALDNGCNVALVIDIARQMQRLGLRPRRTIRFALFNGEEHGLHGSWGYVITHADELDDTVMASSYDIGSGRITGFFTGGRAELLDAVERALEPVRGLGPFHNIDIPIVGTDNFDFMMEGVGNLVANQESANYGPNYHAGTDTFDKVDQHQLRLNAAIAAAVTYNFAEMEVDWKRQTRAEIEDLVESTDLGAQMRTFHMFDAWEKGERGRKD